jgi:hypothetical protein
MVKILNADEEERRQRRLLWVVLAVAVMAGTWAGFDYYDTVSTELLPEDIGKMDVVLDHWRSEGFVRDFVVRDALLLVDKGRWEKRKRVEKMNIVTQLARYCAEKNRTPSFLLRVKAEASGPVLAEIGPRGLKVP